MRRSPGRSLTLGIAIVLAANTVPAAQTAAAAPLTGKLVWVHYDQAQGDTDIWVINADGSDAHPLTTNAIRENDPVWSPDGSQIAFTSQREGETNVYVMAEDGTNVQRLTVGMGDFEIGDWSPVGNELVGVLNAPDGRWLVFIDTDTGVVTQLVSYSDGYSPGSFSPDGEVVLVSRLRHEDPEGGIDIWAIDRSAVFSRVTDTASPTDEGAPVWSPDGASIAYFADGDIHRVDADGTNPTQLTSDPGYDESPAWSPDSASLAFATGRAGDGETWVMNADGTEQRQLISMTGAEGRADWTAGSVVPLATAETVSGPVGPGGSLTTADASPPDIANPTDTTVTSPYGGSVTITESGLIEQVAPDDFTFIGQQVSLDVSTVPAPSAQDPLQLTFVLDATLIPERITDATEVLVFRDGVRVEPCAPGEGEPPATPDPCVLTAFYAGDYDDLTIEVLTSSASQWNFGIAPVDDPPPPTLPESVTGEILPGGILTTDTESDGVTPGDVLETTVTTSPAGDAGTVTITETTEGVGVAGPDFSFLDVFPSITAPPGTAASPIQVEFLIHSTRMPSIPLEELRVLRHGVPIDTCLDGGPAADPEPCVSIQELTASSDVRIVVRTAEVTGLSWTFGYNLPPAPFLMLQSDALSVVDHVILFVNQEIDPFSIPGAESFEITVNGAPVTETGSRLLYQGLRGWQLLSDAGIADGIALLQITWEEGAQPGDDIAITYTPTANPIQDSSGNEMAAFGPASIEWVDSSIDLPIIDDGAGPNHLVLVTAPVHPDLPAASDFSVMLDADPGQILVPTAVTLRHPELGFSVLDFTLPQPVESWQTASLTYTPGAIPLQRVDGTPVGPFTHDVVVNVSGSTPGGTFPDENGGPVTVTLNDYLGNGATTVQITFPSVGEEGGITTFSSIGPSEAPPLSSNFAVGDPPAFYEISTTAAFTPPAEICLTYDERAYADEELVALVHFDGDTWVDVTTSRDTDANRVCGEVDSFSPFGVVELNAGFDFSGFFAPVNNLPTLNTVTAGRAIPVKFSLGGFQGMEIFASGSPSSVLITCDTGSPVDSIETTTSASANPLSYSEVTDQYTYVWKTLKSWAGTCRELRVTFSDGTTATARFKFGE